MHLIINGENQEYDGEETVSALLRQLNAQDDRVATMVNNTIIGKEERKNTALKEGDHVEVLIFAGGG